MATVTPDPLFANQAKAKGVILADTSQGPSLPLRLTTPPPNIFNSFLPAPRRNTYNDDTSQSTPETLLPTITLTSGSWTHPYFQGNAGKAKPFIGLSTAQGTSDALLATTFTAYPDPPNPILPAPYKGRIYSETSRGTPEVLLPLTVLTAGNWVRDPLRANQYKAVRVRNWDTSQSVPLVLTTTPPSVFPPASELPLASAPARRVSTLWDTSQSSSLLLALNYNPLPSENLENAQAPFRKVIYKDTSQSTPLVLLTLPPLVLPAQTLPQPVPQAKWVLRDTTQGSPRALLSTPPTQAPVVGVPPGTPIRPFIYSETSQSAPASLLSLSNPGLPPGVPMLLEAPWSGRVNADTSRSTPGFFFPALPIIALTKGQWVWSGVPGTINSAIPLTVGRWVWRGLPGTFAGGVQFVYQNTNLFEMDFIVQGGVVTLLEFSRGGVNWYNVGVTAGMFHLSVGDYMRCTYTSPPTITGIPR